MGAVPCPPHPQNTCYFSCTAVLGLFGPEDEGLVILKKQQELLTGHSVRCRNTPVSSKQHHVNFKSYTLADLLASKSQNATIHVPAYTYTYT